MFRGGDSGIGVNPQIGSLEGIRGSRVESEKEKYSSDGISTLASVYLMVLSGEELRLKCTLKLPRMPPSTKIERVFDNLNITNLLNNSDKMKTFEIKTVRLLPM